MKDPILADFIASIPPESTRYVELSADILDQVYAILEKKGMTQKQFAEGKYSHHAAKGTGANSQKERLFRTMAPYSAGGTSTRW